MDGRRCLRANSGSQSKRAETVVWFSSLSIQPRRRIILGPGQIPDAHELYIGYNQIEIEDLELLKTELALSDTLEMPTSSGKNLDQTGYPLFWISLPKDIESVLQQPQGSSNGNKNPTKTIEHSGAKNRLFEAARDSQLYRRDSQVYSGRATHCA